MRIRTLQLSLLTVLVASSTTMLPMYHGYYGYEEENSLKNICLKTAKIGLIIAGAINIFEHRKSIANFFAKTTTGTPETPIWADLHAKKNHF